MLGIDCCFLGRHAGREGGSEDMLEELESYASLPYFKKNAAFLAGMPEEREEGRTCWRSWNSLLIFLLLDRMLLLLQACRKRGRKGGHAGGARIHGVSFSPSEDGGSFEGCRHVLESGQVKIFLFLIDYRYRTCSSRAKCTISNNLENLPVE
jgi:hypothetical protein